MLINKRVFFFENFESCFGIFSLTLREEKDFVGSLNKFFFLWPELRYCLDTLKNPFVFESKYHYLML